MLWVITYWYENFHSFVADWWVCITLITEILFKINIFSHKKLFNCLRWTYYVRSELEGGGMPYHDIFLFTNAIVTNEGHKRNKIADFFSLFYTWPDDVINFFCRKFLKMISVMIMWKKLLSVYITHQLKKTDHFWRK